MMMKKLFSLDDRRRNSNRRTLYQYSPQYLNKAILSPLIGRPVFRQSVHCSSIVSGTSPAVVKCSHSLILPLQVQQL